MTAARDEILARIRAALVDVPDTERVERFAERGRDYQADVRRVTADELPGAVDAVCAELGLATVAVPPQLPPQWRPTAVEVVPDEGLTAEQLDAINGAVTGCATAIAETGTIVLDGQARSGRRLLTLVPDHHLCLVAEDQIVELVPEAIALLAAAVTERQVPVTLVSGPSASSDIELSRVEGVHGPRHLVVLIVAP